MAACEDGAGVPVVDRGGVGRRGTWTGGESVPVRQWSGCGGETPYLDWATAECDDGYVGPAPMGSSVPKGQGVDDMKGNVWEWVADCWKGDCRRRVVRGGSWDNIPEHLRAADRDGDVASLRLSYDGFRVARRSVRDS